MKHKSKGPPNCPKTGDFCKMRGGNIIGRCIKIYPNLWVYVEWDAPQSRAAPKWSHLYELEKIDMDTYPSG